MRKLIILLACWALCSVSSFVFADDYYSNSYARLSYVNGDVFVQRAEDLGYEEGVVNLAMIEGDKLGTREGRAEIHFGQRNYLRIDSYTQIDLVVLPQRGLDSIKLHLLSGNIFLRINHLERERDFEIHTPDASFYILDEGLYNLSVKQDYETELRVYAGTAEAAGETGSVLVDSVEKIVVADGRIVSDPGNFYASYDDSFYEWNKSREALSNRYVGRTYLPSELYEYEAELDYYGNWVYEGSYGYVWVPRVHHQTWRPYWNGRWVWYPIIGWNWVSYEPWGWCVSHYGRWHWRLGLGWYWIPTRHWGPAWVHWYHGTDYYGWCPLSYYDYPGVIIDNHYYARHNYQAYPAHSRTLVVVHKNQLQARHISRAALSGAQASRLGKVSLSSRQLGAKPAINRSGTIHSKAARTLARTDVRQVGRSYASKGAVGSDSRVSSSRSRSSSQRGVGADAARKGVPSSSPKQSSARVGSSRFSRSNSTIKTYPSQQRSTSSRSSVTSPRAKGSVNKARVTTGSGVKQEKTYVPGKSIKYYRSRNSSQKSQTTSRSSTSNSKGSKEKATTSKKKNSSQQYSSREYAPSAQYSSSNRSQSSSRRSSSSSRLSARSSGSRSSQSGSARYTAPSRSYSRSRTSTPKYSAPSRSSSRSSYSRSPSSSSKSSSSSTRSGRVSSSSSSRSSGKTTSSSSKSSTRTRKK